MSLSEFAGPGDDGIEAAARAALIGSALQSRGLRALETVLGAGLGWINGQVRPMVIVAKERVANGEGPYPLPAVEAAFAIVAEALGRSPDWLGGTYAYVIPSPEPYLQPGDGIRSPATSLAPGTVGCQASWSGGSGFLTAGHVAPTRKVGVFAGGSQMGIVEFSSNPAGSGSAVQADVAVVEIAAGLPFNSPILGAAPAGPNTRISVLNPGARRSNVMGFCTFVYWPTVGGTYGDTYLTTSAISTGGDSGSAVIDTNNRVIGIIVGGVPSTSFIQDVRYQIAQAAPPGSILSGLTV